jgi:hypothetical protein
VAGAGQGLGGALFNHNGTITVTHSTFSVNTALAGRGIFALGDSLSATTSSTIANVTINNNILGQCDTNATDFWGNITSYPTAGLNVSGSGNLIRTFAGIGTEFNPSIIVSRDDPKLGPLQNNGGPTPTLALLAESPAIDKGLAAGALRTDQRGFSRDANVDIGAFEFGARASQVITFGQLNPVTYGVSPITLSATSSSGLAVTFSVISGPGSISGNTLTVLGGGNIIVQADQAGNAIYAAAAPVRQTLVVNAAPTVIAFRLLYGNGKSYDLTTSTRVRLPWAVTGVEVVFSDAVFGTSASLANGNGALAISGFSGNGTNTLRWTFPSALLTADVVAQLAATGADQIHTAAGVALDGDGNGLGGDAYVREFKVLYGDFDDDGVVTLRDAVLIRNLIGSNNIFADLNGDGQVDATDVNIVRSRLNTRLP